jgi:hypothetical protein
LFFFISFWGDFFALAVSTLPQADLHFTGPLDDPESFSQTSGLSLVTSNTIVEMIEMLSSPIAEFIVPTYRNLAETGLALLETADDLQLLTLR